MNPSVKYVFFSSIHTNPPAKYVFLSPIYVLSFSIHVNREGKHMVWEENYLSLSAFRLRFGLVP